MALGVDGCGLAGLAVVDWLLASAMVFGASGFAGAFGSVSLMFFLNAFKIGRAHV